MDRGHEIVNELEYCLALTKKEILSFDIMVEFESDFFLNEVIQEQDTVWAHVWDLDEIGSEQQRLGSSYQGPNVEIRCQLKDTNFSSAKEWFQESIKEHCKYVLKDIVHWKDIKLIDFKCFHHRKYVKWWKY